MEASSTTITSCAGACACACDAFKAAQGLPGSPLSGTMTDTRGTSREIALVIGRLARSLRTVAARRLSERDGPAVGQARLFLAVPSMDRICDVAPLWDATWNAGRCSRGASRAGAGELGSPGPAGAAPCPPPPPAAR